jgi:hypothetical protein
VLEPFPVQSKRRAASPGEQTQNAGAHGDRR